MAIGYEYVSHIGHTYTLPDSNASFWNTFITDPPCHEVNILSFALNLDYPSPPAQQPNHDPILATVNFLDTTGLTIGSDAGLRMGDVLRVCLTARGHASGLYARPRDWEREKATIREAVQAVRDKVGIDRISTRPHVCLWMRLFKVGFARPLIANDEDRAAANVDWE